MGKTTKIDLVTLTGQSGESYEFRVYVWDTKFKAVPGVYVVASRTIEPGEEPRYQTLFVGAAPNLATALKDHPQDECFQMYYGNVIAVLKEEQDERRSSVVADLVAALAPPCNSVDAP